MSFPPRGPPPLGMPLIPGHPGFALHPPVLGLPVLGPPGVVGVGGPMPPGMGAPMMAPERRPRVFQKPPPKPNPPTEEKTNTITVFVGNITERATDGLIRAVLAKCGYIANWKRAHGANGILQAFGFCEYSEPEAAIRAIRLLNELEIGDKKLMVKADAKTKEMLAKFELDLHEPNGKESYETYCQRLDAEVVEQIQSLLRVHAGELKQKSPSEKEKAEKDEKKRKAGTQESMDDMELDEDKKTLITREIDKFRDAYKKEEEEPSTRRDDKKKRTPSPPPPRGKRRRSRSPRERIRSPKRSSESRRSPDTRAKQKQMDEDERYQKELREKAKERNREILRIEREKRREEKKLDGSDEEELYERRRHEKRLREKEANYQEHLKQWENREKRRAKDYAKDKEKDEERAIEEQREAKRLREFFEDYDDEKDDPKFYQGQALQRRLRERARELEWDQRDRQREKEEFDVLKRKLLEEGHPDPDGEAHRQLRPPSLKAIDDENSVPGKSEDVVDGEITSPKQNSKNTLLKIKPHVSEEERLAREQREAKEKSKEDKLRHIKSLVDKIPANKEELFAYNIDRSLIDESLVKRKVRPWINKKVIEYIGEEEVTLVDFICTRVVNGADANSLLNDVSLLLDDEAENFIVKMWRLLIYETETKKLAVSVSR